MGKRLYVGNISFDVGDEELEQAFSEYGEISSAKVVSDRYTGRSKGFGFVEFVQEEDAQKAMAEMNGKELNGRAIKVDEARETQNRDRGDRGQRSGGYGSDRRSRY